MRRSVVFALFAVVWLMMPALATADHGIESAHGGGRTELLSCEPLFCVSGSVSFSAQDGPGGVRGSYHSVAVVQGTGDVFLIRGEVDCLNVVGNTAIISGEVVQESGFGEDPVFDRFMIIATDNGNPEGGTTTDVVSQRFTRTGVPSETDPTTCITTADSVSLLHLTSGNVTVHDDV